MVFKRIVMAKPNGRKGLGFSSDIIPIGLEYIAASIDKEVDSVHTHAPWSKLFVVLLCLF